jgi:signal transduction histidine kinase
MKSLTIILCAAAMFVMMVGYGYSAGTPAEAEAMVKKAIAFYKANGQEKAFAEISNPTGQFVKDDLYVFVYDMKGKCVAHGFNQKMVGKDLIDLKDADGKFFVKERVEIAKTKGKGWQDYMFTNPTNKKLEHKTAYVEKVDDFIFGCGAYKK